MRFLTTLVFMLLAVPSFASTTLNTSTIGAFGDDVVCTFVNVSKKPISVLVSATDGQTGDVLASQQLSPNPGLGTLLVVSKANGFVYCSFEFSGGSKSIRAALVLADPATGLPAATLPAS